MYRDWVAEDAARRPLAAVRPVSIAWTAIAVPTLLGLVLDRPMSTGAGWVSASAIACQLAMIACSLCFALDHRLTDSSASAWMAVGLAVPPVVVSLTGLVSTVLAPDVRTATASCSFVVGGIAALVCFSLAATAGEPHWGPIPLGLGAGVAISVIAVLSGFAISSSPVLRSTALQVVVSVLGVPLAVTAGRSVLAHQLLPIEVRGALLVAGVLLAGGAAVVTWAGSGLLAVCVATVLHLSACVAFATTAVGLLSVATRGLVVDRASEHGLMRTAQRDLRSAEVVLHEARSTMAGLSSAAHLLDDRRHELSAPDRARLVEMSASEMDRMTRILGRDDGEDLDGIAGLAGIGRIGLARPGAVPVDLVAVIGPLLESLRSQGHRVTLVHTPAVPSHTLARADDVAEVVHILLDNAARHGSGAAIVVDVVSLHSLVGVTVVDDGPGVPEEMRATLFQWGTSRPGSVGRGIGLHVALARAQGMGGDLRLTSSVPGRTSFELTLPGVVAECA